MDQTTRVLDPMKFRDPLITAKGDKRATVTLRALETLWFNTGTLCNLTCRNCYIDSSPRNDRLAYLTTAEVERYLDEVVRDHLPTKLIGLTGGEPLMNPDIIAMPADKVQPTPDVGSEAAGAFVLGVMAIEDRMVSLIALESVMPAQAGEAA